MTIEQLKELLSTYGANEDERNALAYVEINGILTPIVEAEVDWTFGGGHALLLRAEEPA